MSLDSDDIQKLCNLSQLAVSEPELPDVCAKLSDIVGLVDQLQAVDTGDIEPLAHPLDRPQRLRNDTVTETDQHAQYQANAASVERGLYLVPKVIE